MPVRLAGVGTVGGVAIEKRSCGPGELNAFVASGPSPTDDEVSITTDGRRLHSAEAVIAFVAKLKGEDFVEEVVRERTVSNPEFPALVEAARVRHGGPRRSWLALTVWPSGSSRRGRTHEANLGGPPQIPVRAPCYPVNRGTIGAQG